MKFDYSQATGWSLLDNRAFEVNAKKELANVKLVSDKEISIPLILCGCDNRIHLIMIMILLISQNLKNSGITFHQVKSYKQKYLEKGL